MSAQSLPAFGGSSADELRHSRLPECAGMSLETVGFVQEKANTSGRMTTTAAAHKAKTGR